MVVANKTTFPEADAATTGKPTVLAKKMKNENSPLFIFDGSPRVC